MGKSFSWSTPPGPPQKIPSVRLQILGLLLTSCMYPILDGPCQLICPFGTYKSVSLCNSRLQLTLGLIANGKSLHPLVTRCSKTILWHGSYIVICLCIVRWIFCQWMHRFVLRQVFPKTLVYVTKYMLFSFRSCRLNAQSTVSGV